VREFYISIDDDSDTICFSEIKEDAPEIEYDVDAVYYPCKTFSKYKFIHDLIWRNI
jgi:hypothetical protein